MQNQQHEPPITPRVGQQRVRPQYRTPHLVEYGDLAAFTGTTNNMGTGDTLHPTDMS